MSESQDVSSFIQFDNIKTGKPYWLCRARLVKPTKQVIADIVSCCNEPNIYNRIYRQKLAESKFCNDDARIMVRWMDNNTHCYFIMCTKGYIIGAVHIIGGMLGFWCSSAHRGVMRKAVSLVIKEYQEGDIIAVTDIDNVRCQEVLSSNGFTSDNKTIWKHT